MSSIKSYCEQDNFVNIIEEKEVLNQDQLFNEYVLTSIRTSWGCDLEHINNLFGEKYSRHFLKNVKMIINEKKIFRKGNVFTLTNKGKLYADGISSSLFYGI